MHWIDLTDVLRPIEFAVVGGVATRLYMPERFTKDLDIVVSRDTAAAAREALEKAGFLRSGDLSIQGSTWLGPNQEEIDVLEGQEPWWTAAISLSQANRDAQGLPILPLHYLVLMKYQSGRAQDLADIERMLGQATDRQLKEARHLFRELYPDDLEDLESLIELGRLSH